MIEPDSKTVALRGAPPGARAPWQQPVLKIVPAEMAETGVNSTTDASVTFS